LYDAAGKSVQTARARADWLTGDRNQLGDSLAHFMVSHPYGVEALRHDLARFRSLLGEDEPAICSRHAGVTWA
jgi:hypothetical protein